MDLSPTLARTSPASATFGECCWERGVRATIPCSRYSRSKLAVWVIAIVPNEEPLLLCPGTWCSCRSRGICTTAGSCARRRMQRCWLPTSCRVGLCDCRDAPFLLRTPPALPAAHCTCSTSPARTAGPGEDGDGGLAPTSTGGTVSPRAASGLTQPLPPCLSSCSLRS